MIPFLISSHDAEMTTEQNIYTQNKFRKFKNHSQATIKVENTREVILAAVCMPVRVISLQIQNRKYTYQQPGNLPGLGIWHALCGLEIFWAKQ